MSIYLAVAAYLFSAAWVDVKGTAGLKKGVCLCSIFVLSIFIGLRDETGTDWLFYEDHYTNLANGITWENYNFDIKYIKTLLQSRNLQTIILFTNGELGSFESGPVIYVGEKRD